MVQPRAGRGRTARTPRGCPRSRYSNKSGADAALWSSRDRSGHRHSCIRRSVSLCDGPSGRRCARSDDAWDRCTHARARGFQAQSDGNRQRCSRHGARCAGRSRACRRQKPSAPRTGGECRRAVQRPQRLSTFARSDARRRRSHISERFRRCASGMNSSPRCSAGLGVGLRRRIRSRCQQGGLEKTYRYDAR